MNLKIYCDGGSRGNPGPAAYGFVVLNGHETVFEGKGYIGIATNNVAEYSGILKAMQWLEKNDRGVDKVEFILDSELATKQLTGVYKIKNKTLKTFAEKILEIKKKLTFDVTYFHVKRDKNKRADLLVNIALDEESST